MGRFGVRRVMLAALTTLAIAVGLSTLMQNVWQLVLLWGVLVGLGSGAMALVLSLTEHDSADSEAQAPVVAAMAKASLRAGVLASVGRKDEIAVRAAP